MAAVGCRQYLVQRNRLGDLRRSDPSRLLRRLVDDLAPARNARCRGLHQVLSAALSDYLRDCGYAQLGQLFQRPFQSVELEDGEKNGNMRKSSACDFRSQLKLDPIIRSQHDLAQA